VGAHARCKTPISALFDRCELVFGIGPAGTGKKPISRSPSPRAMLEARRRGAASSCRARRVEAGERLGFLPGDMKEKVDPYLRPALRRAFTT